MEDIAPTHNLIIEMIYAIEGGHSVLSAAQGSLKTISGSLNQELRALVKNFEMGRDHEVKHDLEHPEYREALFHLLKIGFSGQPILKRLYELEIEIQIGCDAQVESFMNKLPIRMILPVLLFQFPALVLVVVGPILNQFIREILR